MDLILRNTKLVSNSSIIDADIGIENGKIAAVGQIKNTAEREIDCKGKYILPGLIDIHVHFRDPGYTEKGDFKTESEAAVAGGVTSIIDMPNTSPPTVTCEALEQKRKIASQKSLVNYGFFIGGTDNNFTEIERAENIAGIKIYMAFSTGGLLMQDLTALEKIFQLGKLIIVHAEKQSIISENEEKYKDRTDPRIHSLIRDHKSAYEAVKEALHLAKKYNTRIHITHISTAEEVDEIQKFKTEKVTCDTCPHYLYLTNVAYASKGNFVKINPPLREEKDRQALFKALQNGIIDIVASDHAPHTKEEKQHQYWNASAGVPGIETTLPLLLDSANHGEFSLSQIAKMTSYNPAKLFTVANKGEIKEGFDADLVVVDMEEKREIQDEKLFAKCKWSPFTGWHLQGWPIITIVNGNVVFENGKITDTEKGKELKFK